MHDEPVAGDPPGSASALPGGDGDAVAFSASSVVIGKLRAGMGGLHIPESAALLVVLGALLAFFSIKSPVFLTQDNLINVLIAVATIGILACPATMLLVAGQFDLSVGSGIALTSSAFAYLITHNWATGLAVLLTIGLGILGGMLNGFLVTVVGINALITTLGTLAIYSGFSFVITSGIPIGFNGFGQLALERPLLNIPWSVFIFFGFIAASVFVLRMTVFGRSLYAIGANRLAARLAGIRVGRTIFIGFVLSGFAVGIAGLVSASQTGQGSGTAGQGYELTVVTAVILGGASLAGGRGSIFGTVIGLLILGIIDNGLTLLNVQSFWQDVVRGTLLICAVGFDVMRRRLTEA
jgi:ribose transport system permease protein